MLLAAGLVLLVPVGTGATSPAAITSLPLAFSSTLPSWPPPVDLGAEALYSVRVTGRKPQVLDRASRDGGVVSSQSPDGTRVAFARDDGGAVWLVDADGSSKRLLFVSGPAAQEFVDLESAALVWAPDGRSIALTLFSTRYCGPSSTKCAVWYVVIVALDGQRLGTIYSARNPSWSPDSRRLVVERNDIFPLEPEATTIDIVRPSGETIRTVGRPTSRTRDAYVCLAYPHWSPDARFVAFDESSCNGSPLDRFHVVRTVDGRPVLTANGWAMDWEPRRGLLVYGNSRRFYVARTRDSAVVYRSNGSFGGWGSRPGSVVYVGLRPTRSLYVGGPDSAPRQLAESTTGCVTFSARGSRLYYASGERGHPLYSMRTDGRGAKRLVPRTSGECARPSPDGRLLAFWRTDRRLAVADARGGSARVVARFPEGNRTHLLSWAEGASRLLYTSYVSALPRPALWLMSADGTVARRVTDVVGASDPTWSPDGTRIAFARTPAEGEKPGGLLSVVRASGGVMRTIVRLRGQHVSSPSWSPDGSTIAYSCGDGYAICAVRADGTRRRIVIAPERNPSIGQIYFWSPDWSPDSRWIVYAKGQPGEGGSIRAVRPDGTGDHALVPPHADGSVFNSVAVSPDGARLAVGGSACVSPEPCRPGIWIVATSGAGLRFVPGTEGGEAPTWSPDGRTIAFAAPTGVEGQLRELFTVAADGGPRTPITPFRANSAEPDWSNGD